jgi:hypothetical protein
MPVDDPHQILRLDRVSFRVLERTKICSPFLHVGLGLFQEATVGLALEQGQQRVERRARVADERHVRRHAVSDTHGVTVDLDAPDLARLREVARVGEVRTDHQQGVAALDDLFRRSGPEQPETARGEGMVIRDRRLPRQRLHDRAPELLGHGEHSVAGVHRADSDEHHDLLALVQHLGGAFEVLVSGHPGRLDEHRRRRRRPARTEAAFPGIGVGRRLLHVDRERQVRNRPVRE